MNERDRMVAELRRSLLSWLGAKQWSSRRDHEDIANEAIGIAAAVIAAGSLKEAEALSREQAAPLPPARLFALAKDIARKAAAKAAPRTASHTGDDGSAERLFRDQRHWSQLGRVRPAEPTRTLEEELWRLRRLEGASRPRNRYQAAVDVGPELRDRWFDARDLARLAGPDWTTKRMIRLLREQGVASSSPNGGRFVGAYAAALAVRLPELCERALRASGAVADEDPDEQDADGVGDGDGLYIDAEDIAALQTRRFGEPVSTDQVIGMLRAYGIDMPRGRRVVTTRDALRSCVNELPADRQGAALRMLDSLRFRR